MNGCREHAAGAGLVALCRGDGLVRSGDRPRVVVTGEPERDESLEVDGRSTMGPADAVADHAAVAGFAVSSSDHPRDRPFDHRPVPPVDVIEPAGAGLAAGSDEQIVMLMKRDAAPGC